MEEGFDTIGAGASYAWIAKRTTESCNQSNLESFKIIMKVITELVPGCHKPIEALRIKSDGFEYVCVGHEVKKEQIDK